MSDAVDFGSGAACGRFGLLGLGDGVCAGLRAVVVDYRRLVAGPHQLQQILSLLNDHHPIHHAGTVTNPNVAHSILEEVMKRSSNHAMMMPMRMRGEGK